MQQTRLEFEDNTSIINFVRMFITLVQNLGVHGSPHAVVCSS